jgi:BirA family biotin operon repressor/biotin-[acetyl-CoA-carboxylase] ligase
MYDVMSRLPELPLLIETRFSEIRFVEETGSTNADLLAEGRAGAAEGAVLVAGHQTAGRGRQQRVWHDEPGGALLVSVLLRPARDAATLMPLLSGMAGVDGLAALADELGSGPDTPAGLKWPNDVLAPSLDGRKLAGILSESVVTGDSNRGGGGAGGIVVVPGMGMNLRWNRPPPAEIAQRAATVEELLGVPVERERLLHLYLRSLEFWLRVVESGGPGRLLDGYRQRCVTLGRRVRFETSASVEVGVAVDVSDTGTLILEREDGSRVELNAGDAHHLPADPSPDGHPG